MEKVLTELVRICWPWDEDGRPNEILHDASDGFAPALLVAEKLTSQSHWSLIARQEPKN